MTSSKGGAGGAGTPHAPASPPGSLRPAAGTGMGSVVRASLGCAATVAPALGTVLKGGPDTRVTVHR